MKAATRCYLCGFDPLDPKVSTCGVKDCPQPCPTCKGIRYRTCTDCKQGVNSFADFREGRLKPEMYPTLTDWYREGERQTFRDAERPLQPEKDRR